MSATEMPDRRIPFDPASAWSILERPLGQIVLVGHERLIDEPDGKVAAQDAVCTQSAPRVGFYPST